ncbi:MAG TPA: heavy metal transporter [Clostridiales bacterium]|nr:MAG: heavy metal transporter [Clostridiales bacterium GWD2_32_59]HAN10690.1 heavy metal transporter [Clostridiales bacterium]
MKLEGKILKIEGMTCVSCERKIEKELQKLDGIIEVKASYENSSVITKFDSNVINLHKITDTIEKAGYKLKAGEQKMSMEQLLGIGIIIFAIYMIINSTIGFNFIPEVSQNMSYGILFVVGLLTSLHCIAMCGGINLSQCVSYKVTEEKSKFSKLKPSFLYNVGRVMSYTIIGGIVGMLGGIISFSGSAKGLVAIMAGVFMVVMGLNMLNIFPWFRKINIRMPKIFANKIHSSKGHGPFYVGLLNGLMPCGPLQTMQLYALGTGSFIAGATSMFVFSLGTVPLMFGFGAISSILSKRFTQNMLKVSAVLVMILGIIMVDRGLNLSGLDLAIAAPQEVSSRSDNIAKVEENVQYVSTTMDGGDYTHIVVQKGIPVKWTITATSDDLNGCNNPMTIPKYNIVKKLVPGENIIEFTPEEEGNIVYTCWMGMVRSTIKVVGDVNKVDIWETEQEVDEYGTGAGLGGCCGG